MIKSASYPDKITVEGSAERCNCSLMQISEFASRNPPRNLPNPLKLSPKLGCALLNARIIRAPRVRVTNGGALAALSDKQMLPPGGGAGRAVPKSAG